MFKLTQGELIAPDKLELAYEQSLFVSQIFVYGDKCRSYLVAIIVPEKNYLKNWCSKNEIPKINYFDCCKDKVSIAVLLFVSEQSELILN